ncbi:MAG: hypothetical protein ACFFDN_44395, partial [Candidatus Hodarchaeota archaeon]
FAEASSDKLRAFDEFELSKFNEYFEKYFKEIKKESEDEIKNRANDLIEQRENLLHCKYHSTEHDRTIRMHKNLEENEVDWIFANLRCAFYDKADYYLKLKDYRKEIKDTKRLLISLEKCKYLEPTIKEKIEKLLVNRQIGLINAPKIQDMNYKPTGGKKSYFWTSKVAIYIIIEFLNEKYNFKPLKAAQLITAISYNLNLISRKTTSKKTCPTLSSYKDAKRRYQNESLLPFNDEVPFSYKIPPKFPQGLDFPLTIPLKEKYHISGRAVYRTEKEK